MNKDAAMKRLEAIEKETAELKKIIESPDRLVYDKSKFYVATDGTWTDILVGNDDVGFMWVNAKSFIQFYTHDFAKTGQGALDDMKDWDIHVFHDYTAAFTFILSKESN